MKKNLGCILLIATAGITMQAPAQPKLNENNINESAVDTTPGKKAHLVVGMGINFGAFTPKKDSSKAAAPQQSPVLGTTQDKVPVAAYPFGYKLSCSNFTYGNLKLSSPSFKNSITATLTITNQGKRPGKEMVKIYISAPSANMDKPVGELKAFAETKLLQPGETATLQFTVKAADLASFYIDKSAWIANAGKYTLKAGTSPADLRLSADFNLPNDIIVEKANKVLVPQQPISDIKPAADATGFIYDLNGFGGTAGM